MTKLFPLQLRAGRPLVNLAIAGHYAVLLSFFFIACGGSTGGSLATSSDLLPLDSPYEEFDRRVRWEKQYADEDDARENGFFPMSQTTFRYRMDVNLANAESDAPDSLKTIRATPENLNLLVNLSIEAGLVFSKFEEVLKYGRNIPTYNSFQSFGDQDPVMNQAMGIAISTAKSLQKGEFDWTWVKTSTDRMRNLNRRINALAALAQFGGAPLKEPLMGLGKEMANAAEKKEMLLTTSPSFVGETLRIENEAIEKSNGTLKRKDVAVAG